jgi:16S rRNA (cytidine1402-2'-O)-methyltransferase
MQPALYIISTPIGNLKDITLRAVEALQSVDVIACEDTRVTQKLLNHLGINKKLFVYNDHSKESEREKIFNFLNEGKSVGLVSDAGTPLISDPGYKLIKQAMELNIKIVPIPGVSSVITALTISGLPSDNFYFAGFLPNKSGERQEKLKYLKTINSTLIIFESPNRAGDMLVEAFKIFGNKPATLTRELTKLFEETNHSDLKTLSEKYLEKEIKGEVVILIDNSQIEEVKYSQDEILTELKKLKAKFSVKDSAKIAEETLNISKKEAYKLLLEI